MRLGYGMDRYSGALFDGRYRLLEMLGSGTSAEVYRAVDTENDLEVAVKIFDEARMADEEAKRQFDHEVKAFALLDTHPNIVSYYGGSMREGCRYIVMELAVGETLAHYMNLKGGRLPLDEALSYFSQVLSALAHAHSKGVIHRDVKPQNIRLVSGGLVKLCDFGIAMIPGFEYKAGGKAVGTVNYISPEQATGCKVDARSDLYSAGILLYEMLSGHLPFQSDKKNAYDRMDEIIHKHLKETPARPGFFNPNIPTAIEQIVLRAINKNPAKRFQSATEMLSYIKLYYENPRIQFEFDLPDDPYDAYDALPEETDAKRFISEALKLVGTVESGEKKESPKSSKESQRRSTRFLIGVFSILLVSFAVVAALCVNRLFFFDAGESTVITVGEILYTSYDDALAATLSEKGYDVVIEYRYDKTYPLNTILSQEPGPHEAQKVAKGEKPTLTLTLSGGCRIIVMPDFIGDEHIGAKLQLTEQGFTVKEIEQFSSEYPAGTIIATEPVAGDAAIQSDDVVFYVSKGKEVIYRYVPSLVGYSAEEAMSKLSSSGIQLGGVTYEESDAPSGVVIAQSRPYGEKIAVDYASVAIVVSKGRVLSP